MRSRPSALRDFTVDRRVWLLTAVALFIGPISALHLIGWALRCIRRSVLPSRL
jgi:hypothetical protein